MNQMTFTIYGKIKPFVRMTRRGKWTDPQAQEYLASKEAIAWQISEVMAANGWQMLPARTPLAVNLKIETPKVHTCDLDNIAKATLDSANGIIYPDDRWIDEIITRRVYKAEYRARLTVGVYVELE